MITGDYRINDNQSANMRKTHFYVCPVCGNIITSDNVSIIKLFPEQDIAVRLKKRGHGIIYAYCNRDGMFKKIV